MWHEFNNHFKNPTREKGKQINHHDFLDGSFLPKKDKPNMSRRTFFSNVGGRSLGEFDKESAVDLGRQRLFQTKVNYEKLQKNCYEIQLNKEKAGIPKWLQSKLKAEGKKELEPRVYKYQSQPMRNKPVQ